MTEPVGWIGAGRMGAAMVRRLLAAEVPVVLWNRTASRVEPLVTEGATRAESFAAVIRPVTVTSLAASADLLEVVGRVAALDERPEFVVDTSTVSVAASAAAREQLAAAGIGFLSAPVSGNPGAVAAGTASFVCSGDRAAFEAARPLLETIGVRASLLGSGEESRLAKLAHNLLLAIVMQGLSEVLVMCAERGVPTASLLEFLNDSVVGSTFTRYKTPAILAGDLTPTFTTRLMLKDVDLGLAEGTESSVPMPLAAQVRTQLIAAIAQGHAEEDFLSLLAVQAAASGVALPAEE